MPFANYILYQSEAFLFFVFPGCGDSSEATMEKAPTKKYEKDVFICFAHKDLATSEEIREELERRGYKCFHSETDFQPGSSIVSNILQGITISKKMVLLVSEKFVNSSWTKFEVRN